jgi:hypothetical protein
MSEIKKGLAYANRRGEVRLVLDIGQHVMLHGRKPYSGVEYVFVDGDGVRSVRYRDYLSTFATNSTHLVPGV